jgi:uncharacterized protein (DUF488 family)
MARSENLCIYTIGHSTLAADAFVERLKSFEIKTVADVRSLPGSRRWPQFDREAMEVVLPLCGIAYVWLKALGGRRSRGLGKNSPNLAWDHLSFRNYADYMLTPDFQRGTEQLLGIGRKARTAIMCAEAVYWRCHRRLISDFLVAHGVRVEHVMSVGKSRPHVLAAEARLRPDGTLVYPGNSADLFMSQNG